MMNVAIAECHFLVRLRLDECGQSDADLSKIILLGGGRLLSREEY